MNFRLRFSKTSNCRVVFAQRTLGFIAKVLYGITCGNRSNVVTYIFHEPVLGRNYVL